jgi:UDP-2-acetamido-2,6-beta-L-arabino-hexul-4-ose reductase
MRILVTGASGFIGQNLCIRLSEKSDFEVFSITRESSLTDLQDAVSQVDIVFHLAGVNRPQNIEEFHVGNALSTQSLCSVLAATQREISLVYTSSTQAELDNPYGQSKLAAEKLIIAYGKSSGSNTFIYRLPNVFGKWCKPNYNSAVATFCYNIARELPVSVNNPSAVLKLVHIDDVMNEFLHLLEFPTLLSGYHEIRQTYSSTVGEIVAHIQSFKNNRDSLLIDHVGTGFIRALYSTYVSYLPTNSFSYKVAKHCDSRGVFVEMLRTPDSGQFSFFTANPGITRGDHYHHTKTEKFLVIKGKARFCFRNIVNNETYELIIDSDEPEFVETVPGWIHNITNIGEEEMIVMLWANEIFDQSNPDTFAEKV